MAATWDAARAGGGSERQMSESEECRRWGATIIQVDKKGAGGRAPSGARRESRVGCRGSRDAREREAGVPSADASGLGASGTPLRT